MNIDFYNQPDFKYPEIAICMEDTEGPTAKIFVPVMVPSLSDSLPYITTNLPLDICNVKSNNISKSNLTRVSESNYIELPLPDDNPASKGDKFIIVFVGGDPNNGVLIGRLRNEF